MQCGKPFQLPVNSFRFAMPQLPSYFSTRRRGFVSRGERNCSMPFDNPSKSMYSQDDWNVMQAAYNKAVVTLVVKSSSEEEAKIIAETVMTAFNRGNRDVNSLAALAVITAINSHPGVIGGDVNQQKRYA
ncbi:MAG TPA: hypothetical protein VK602_04615 [Phyllobacterium sp.]|nr:hypothetical protein [Phyllobacterium sp.]